MRRETSASAFARSSAESSCPARASSASSGRPSAHVTSHAASSKALPVPWPNETSARFRRSLCAWTSSTSVMVRPWRCAPSRQKGIRASEGRAGSRDEALERAPVDVFQRLEAGHFDAFVDLVDARIDRAEFDDLGTDALDEAAVRRAAGRRELAGDAGVLADGRGERIAQGAGRRQEGLAAERPGQVVGIDVLLDDRLEPRLERG